MVRSRRDSQGRLSHRLMECDLSGRDQVTECGSRAVETEAGAGYGISDWGCGNVCPDCLRLAGASHAPSNTLYHPKPPPAPPSSPSSPVQLIHRLPLLPSVFAPYLLSLSLPCIPCTTLYYSLSLGSRRHGRYIPAYRFALPH